MIDVVCPCGRKISVPDHFAGKRGTCKGCGGMLKIPHSEPPLLDSKFQFTDDELLAAVKARPGDQPSSVAPMDAGLDLASNPTTPIVAIHAEMPTKAKRSPWKDPVILIGVGGPAIVLAWFAFFLYRDQSQKSFEAGLRTKKVEADDLLKRNLPVDAWRKYDEVISLADRGTTLNDDIKAELLNAREQKAKLDGQVRAILDAQRATKEALDKEDRERNEVDAKVSALRDKLRAIDREYLDEQASFSRFKATLSGAAYITNGLGYARALPGLKVYIVPSRVERRRMDGILAKLIDRTNESTRLGDSARLFSMAPPDTLIELRGVHDIIRVSADGAMSKDSEVRFLSVSRDPLWPALILATHIDTFTTNIDGKFRYPDLKGGDYLLCTIFDTDWAFAEWVIPLRVDSNREIEKEFHNGTSDIILNRNK